MKTFFVFFAEKLHNMIAEQGWIPLTKETQSRISSFMAKAAKVLSRFTGRLVGLRHGVRWRRFSFRCIGVIIHMTGAARPRQCWLGRTWLRWLSRCGSSPVMIVGYQYWEFFPTQFSLARFTASNVFATKIFFIYSACCWYLGYIWVWAWTSDRWQSLLLVSWK